MQKLIETICDTIGYTAPVTTFLYAVYVLHIQPGISMNSSPYLLAYIAGFIVNLIINIGVKQMIREPAPTIAISSHPKFNPFSYVQNLSFISQSLLHYVNHTEQYGMPSLFVQSVCFTTMYVFQVLRSFKVLAFMGIISLLTAFNMWKYKLHSVSQILAGIALGSLLGYITFVAIYHHLHKPIFGEP